MGTPRDLLRAADEELRRRGMPAEADARLRYEADAHPDAHADYPQELAA